MLVTGYWIKEGMIFFYLSSFAEFIHRKKELPMSLVK
jgi:hypothetical protein